MSTVTTTRPIDVIQLTAELGVGLTVSDDGTTRTITADIDEAALRAAVDAHTPEPPPPTAAELLQAQVDELGDLVIDLLG